MNRTLNSSTLIHAFPVILLFLFMIGMWITFTTAFIADDSYFYLVIARNLAIDGHQTFSGIMSTNGAHPLWLYTLTAWSWIVSTLFGPDILDNPKFPLLLSISLLAGGCITWWKIADILGLNQPILVFVPLAFITFFGVLYSEVHILFFTLSLLVLTVILQKGGLVRYALIGVLGGLVALSRLDAVFLVGALGVTLLAVERYTRGLAVMLLVFATITLPYLVANYLIFGHVVPVSGYTKSSFPEIFIRGIQTQGGGLSLSFEGYSIIFGIIPILLALVLWPSYKDRLTKLIIATLLGGAILQFLQITLFTKSSTSWYWYYLIPVTLGALAVSSLAGRLGENHFNSRTSVFFGLLCVTAALVVATVIIRHDTPLSSVDEIPSVAFVSERNITDSTFLVSDRPGDFAYYSPLNRVVAADMLTGNVSFVREMENSQNAMQYLFDEASAIGSPVQYVIYMGGRWLMPSPNLECIIYNGPLRHPVRHRIGLAYLGQPTEVSVDGQFIVWDASSPRFDVASDDSLCGGEKG